MATSRRKSRTLKQVSLACAALLFLGSAGHAVAGTQAQAPESENFDFDNGNALEIVLSQTANMVRKSVSPDGSDAPLVVRIVALTETALFDAIAPYHRTAVGIHSDLGRRPASEAETNKNKNIAMLYAGYRTLNSLMPQHAADWRNMMTSVGLDPDDTQENKNTPVGIGNLAGKGVVANREHDGMNQLGDKGGREYHRQPYADYTGYKPVNTPYELRNPSRWQPGVITNGNGLFTAQQFITPQMGRTTPFSYKDPMQFSVPEPRNSDYQNNYTGYKKQADEVLSASAGLTDEHKARAEFFHDKFNILGRAFPDDAIPPVEGRANVDAFVQRAAGFHIAAFDTLIVLWAYKVKYDTVRPFSAIRHLYKGKRITAWGGPGKGTVKDLPGEQWQPYLRTSDHPEYPSGSSGMCGAVAQFGRKTGGSDATKLSYTMAKGRSSIEPGVTPAQDITLSWTTWSQFAQDCIRSRVLGGAHFTFATEVGRMVGTQVADRAYTFMQSHINGQRPTVR